jgi:hypothetical protein
MNLDKTDNFRYNVTCTLSNNQNNNKNYKFNFYKNNENIGNIIYYIEYNQITIGWLSILESGLTNPSVSYHRKGYGTFMLKIFEKYVLNKYPQISKFVLIPKYFDGINKNYLCYFYEKSGFIQESTGYPFYIKNLR